MRSIFMPKPGTARSLQKVSKTKFYPSELMFNSEHNERKWLHRQGKQSYLSLSDQVILKLRQYFNALDCQRCQFISVQNLENPFIVFGLCQNRQEVEKYVKLIDADLSEVIEFDEFVQIFKAAKNNKKLKTRKNKFGVFSKIACGDGSNKMQSSVSIETSISEYSRKLIINMLHRKNQQAVVDGKRVARHITTKNERNDLLPALDRYQ